MFWASKLLFRATRSFARWIASLFVRVSGKDDDGEAPNRVKASGTPNMPAHAENTPSNHATLPEGGTRNA